MDTNLLIPTLLAAVLGVLGYFLRRLITAHDRLQKDFEAEWRRIQDELTKIRGGIPEARRVRPVPEQHRLQADQDL